MRLLDKIVSRDRITTLQTVVLCCVYVQRICMEAKRLIVQFIFNLVQTLWLLSQTVFWFASRLSNRSYFQNRFLS